MANYVVIGYFRRPHKDCEAETQECETYMEALEDVYKRQGPISSYAQTADTLFEGNPLTMENLAQGSVRIFWGLFKKLLIADRLYLLVDVIFNNYQYHYGEMIVIVAIAYTTQLYMEFSGCMDIIIGSGKMFGVTLPENFRQPFFSKSAAEFWRRWHITLGVWFKTYVFYPVSVSGIVKKWNKFGKKHCGKYLTKLGISALCLFPVSYTHLDVYKRQLRCSAAALP